MKKKSQIWVENAIYILIGIILISILLAIAYPQIQKIRDRGLVKQTLSAFDSLDSTIEQVQNSGATNVKIIDFKIAKGSLEIDSANNKIIYVLEDTKLELSEVGQSIEYRNKIFYKTENYGGAYKITIEKTYENLDLTYRNEEKSKKLSAGPTPYSISIENKGEPQEEGKTIINFGVLD